jgi:hypothetical protein
MTFRTHFTFRVDTWTPDGESVMEHIAGIEDYQVALATFRAACERWPGALRQGARVIEDKPAAALGLRQAASGSALADRSPDDRDFGRANQPHTEKNRQRSNSVCYEYTEAWETRSARMFSQCG